MEKTISKIKTEFPSRVLTGINACLKVRDATSATILICCAIDLFSKYYAGESRSSKTAYITFLSDYFSQYKDHESFYKFVRCGLLHSFNLDKKYIIINSNANWAQSLNMKLSPKHKMTIINPWQLKKDLKLAVDKYGQDLISNKSLRTKIRRIYRRFPLEGQTMKIAKFKYLLNENT